MIDFQDASQEVIEKEITNLRNTKPELFEEKVDYSTISFEDLQKRVRTRSSAQTSEDQGPPLTHPELEVADAGFQYFYGKADNDAERAKRLVSVFGEEGIEQRGPNNFILNLDNIEATIKDKYDLPDSGTMPVNRKGFSRYDLARFGGE